MTKKQRQLIYFIFASGLIIALLMVWNSNQKLHDRLAQAERKNTILSEKNKRYKTQLELIEAEKIAALKESAQIPTMEKSIAQLQSEYYTAIQSKKNQLDQLTVLKKQLDSSNQQTAQTKKQIAAKNESISKLKQTLKQAENKAVQLNFTSAEGISVSYFGQVENGEATGFGVGIFDGKGIYRGEWDNNKRHGKGTYTWSNGDFYEGEFLNGKLHGFGTYYFKSGEKYVGNWENNLRNGEGTVFDKNEEILVKGMWENDKLKKKSK